MFRLHISSGKHLSIESTESVFFHRFGILDAILPDHSQSCICGSFLYYSPIQALLVNVILGIEMMMDQVPGCANPNRALTYGCDGRQRRNKDQILVPRSKEHQTDLCAPFTAHQPATRAVGPSSSVAVPARSLPVQKKPTRHRAMVT